MKIYVGNLSFEASQDGVRELFSQHGKVEDVSLVTDRDTGQPRGFGFVEMPEKADAIKAISALDGKDFGGRALKVNEAKPKPAGGGGGGFGGGGGGGGGRGYGGGGGGGRDRR